MVKAQVYIFVKQFDGFPKEDNLKLIEEELPPIKDGEFLAEAIYLSIDPYMRAFSSTFTLGKPLIGGQVAKIVESKNEKYPVGKYVVAQFGCRTYTISDGSPEPILPDWPGPIVLPDFGDLPLSLGIGILGMPGITAYFGLLELCKPKEGETVIITGAAGAVGNIVGQIAKIKGCKVIGVTGSAEKGKLLVDELGFDSFINYKTDDLDKVIPEMAPNGIDCYFDNVGGEISSTILKYMNRFGRIAVCGSISAYNTTQPKASVVQWMMLAKELRMEGFMFYRWNDRWTEGVLQLKKWIDEGKLKYKETVTEGFENLFKALIDMFNGRNYGKAVLKI